MWRCSSCTELEALDTALQVPMLQSRDSSQKEGYEQEAEMSTDRENCLAASASSHSDGQDKESKAKVGGLACA